MCQLESLICAMNTAYFPDAPPTCIPTPPANVSEEDAPYAGDVLNAAGGGGIAVAAETEEFTLCSKRHYGSFTPEEKNRLHRVIDDLLHIGDLRIIMRKGSTKWTLTLTPEQAETLRAAVEAKQLAAFDIFESSIEPCDPEHPSVATALLRSNLPLNDLVVEETETKVILRGSVPFEAQRERLLTAVLPALAGHVCDNQVAALSTHGVNKHTTPELVAAHPVNMVQVSVDPFFIDPGSTITDHVRRAAKGDEKTVWLVSRCYGRAFLWFRTTADQAHEVERVVNGGHLRNVGILQACHCMFVECPNCQSSFYTKPSARDVCRWCEKMLIFEHD